MTLAVFTPQLGAVSETFIRRHVEDLVPGGTVVVTRQWHGSPANPRRPELPQLALDQWRAGMMIRLAQRVGAPVNRWCMVAVARFLRRHRVSIVLGEYLDQFVEFAPLLDRMKIPYVVQGHGIDLSAALQHPAMASRYQIYRSARAILTRCEYHRRRLIALGLPESKISVNPGGVDIPASAVHRDEAACRRFLALGRMTPKKGPLYLLEAFRQAAIERPDITLDYIGGGEMLTAARQFVQACGLTNRVRLPGAIDEAEKERLWRSCGIFLQHSITDPLTGDEEGLPAAIQEAMAQGMAVITTRHSGIPEAVEHGVHGLLVAEGDATGMADAILQLAAEPQRAQSFGDAGRTKASHLYSWAAERARLLAAFETFPATSS